jgi:hypothetical protein
MGDTSKTAAAVQADIYRKLTGSQRLAIAFDLSRAVRELAMTGLRHQHPEWSDIEVRRELIRYAFLPDEPPPPFR